MAELKELLAETRKQLTERKIARKALKKDEEVKWQEWRRNRRPQKAAKERAPQKVVKEKEETIAEIRALETRLQKLIEVPTSTGKQAQFLKAFLVDPSFCLLHKSIIFINKLSARTCEGNSVPEKRQCAIQEKEQEKMKAWTEMLGREVSLYCKNSQQIQRYPNDRQNSSFSFSTVEVSHKSLCCMKD